MGRKWSSVELSALLKAIQEIGVRGNKCKREYHSSYSAYSFDHQGCFQLSLLLRTSLPRYAFFFFLLHIPRSGPVELQVSPASFFTVFYEP